MTIDSVQDPSGESLRKILFEDFKQFFGEARVKTKWRSSEDSEDDFDSSLMYTPETDIVIKPFNIRRHIKEDNEIIDSELKYHSSFFDNINRIAAIPYQKNVLNKNPRCFLAIEVGGSGSEKHLLGDMYNASILGKIGLVVAANKATLKSYIRLYEYANFAFTVGKTNQSFGNLAIVDGLRLHSLLCGSNLNT